MKLELKRVAPLRAASVGAFVYGLLTSVIAILILPFLFLATAVAPAGTGMPPGPLVALGVLLLYPIIGVVVGWLTGLGTSFFYNIVIRATGGLLLEFDAIADVPAESR